MDLPLCYCAAGSGCGNSTASGAGSGAKNRSARFAHNVSALRFSASFRMSSDQSIRQLATTGPSSKTAIWSGSWLWRRTENVAQMSEDFIT